MGDGARSAEALWIDAPGVTIPIYLATLIAQGVDTQPPPQQDNVTPALLTAGGAILGVVLTVVVTTINARAQRAHERWSRAFDKRFEAYAGFLSQVSRWDNLRRRQRAVDPEGPDAKEKFAALLKELEQSIDATFDTVGAIEILADPGTLAVINEFTVRLSSGAEPDEKLERQLRSSLRRELGLGK